MATDGDASGTRFPRHDWYQHFGCDAHTIGYKGRSLDKETRRASTAGHGYAALLHGYAALLHGYAALLHGYAALLIDGQNRRVGKKVNGVLVGRTAPEIRRRPSRGRGPLVRILQFILLKKDCGI